MYATIGYDESIDKKQIHTSQITLRQLICFWLLANFSRLRNKIILSALVVSELCSARTCFALVGVFEVRRILAIFQTLLVASGLAILSNDAIGHEDHGSNKGHSFFGVVLSSEGLPVADAVVTIKAAGLALGHLHATTETVSMTDIEGRFWTEGLLEGEHLVVVSSPYLSDQIFSTYVGLKEAELEEFKLKEAYFITGQITDHQGQREPSAKVRASFSPEPADNIRLIQETDEDGSFTLGPFPTGLKVYIGGQDSDGIFSIALPVFPGKHNLTVRLPKRVRIVGTVLDSQSREPLDSFTLWTLPFGNESIEFGHTKANGKLSAMAVATNVDLIVDAPDYFPKYLGRLPLFSVDEYDLGKIRLDRGKDLRGRVFDEENNLPVEGARVVLTAATSTEALPDYGETVRTQYLMTRVNTTSDANGMYSLAPLPFEPRVIEIEADGFLWGEVLVDGSISKLDIPLQKQAQSSTRIHGQLKTILGNPIEGHVRVFNVERNSGTSYSTDSDGKFDIETGIGRHEISAWSKYGDSEEVQLNLTNGESREISFEFDPSGQLTGFIDGLIGRETAKLEISRSKYDIVQSDAYLENGEHQFEGLGSGKFKLTAETSMNRKLVKTLELKQGQNGTATFDFSGRSRLFGVVIASNGANVGFAVEAIPNNPSHTTGWCETYNDRSFEIHGLNEGNYTVKTWRYEVLGNTSRRSEESSAFVQVAGNTRLDVQLSQISVKGTIHPEEARATANVELLRTSNEDPFSYSSKINRKGEFKFTSLSPGDYTLMVTHAEFEPHRQDFSVAGSISDLSVWLVPLQEL